MAEIFKALDYWLRVMVYNFNNKHRDSVNIPTDRFYFSQDVITHVKIGISKKWIAIFKNNKKITRLPNTPAKLPLYLTLVFNREKINRDVRRFQNRMHMMNNDFLNLLEYQPFTMEEAEEVLLNTEPMFIPELDCYYEENEPLFTFTEDLMLTPVDEQIV